MSQHQSLEDSTSASSKSLEPPLSIERRTLLLGATAAFVTGGLSTEASAAPEAPDLSAALAKFRATIPSHFDREYVDNAVVPFFLGSIFAGERPILPMIDLPLTKQDA